MHHLLMMFVFFNGNAHAAKNCDEIKGNIVGKMFCKATSGSESTIEGTETTKEKRGRTFKMDRAKAK